MTVNPPYKPTKAEPCRALDAATGLCHQLEESNYANNVADTIVDIPDHPGRSGVGPMAGSPTVDETGVDEHGEAIKKDK